MVKKYIPELPIGSLQREELLLPLLVHSNVCSSIAAGRTWSSCGCVCGMKTSDGEKQMALWVPVLMKGKQTIWNPLCTTVSRTCVHVFVFLLFDQTSMRFCLSFSGKYLFVFLSLSRNIQVWLKIWSDFNHFYFVSAMVPWNMPFAITVKLDRGIEKFWRNARENWTWRISDYES